MKQTPNSRLWTSVVFFGSLWGLAEATLGYVFHHAMVPGLAGLFMFPVAFFFMRWAYQHTGRLAVILAMAPVAAGIKLIDLFLPTYSVFTTINPVLVILLEAVAVYTVFPALLRHSGWARRFPLILVATVAWKTVFLGVLVLTSLQWTFHSILVTGPLVILRFAVLDSLANAVLITLLLPKVAQSRSDWLVRYALRPLPALCLLLTAIGAEILL
ncbi:MAG: hypothetical protein JXQ27_10140 [Acidobacteria bacterium]|nr:hypothetical protein [Acidobacteriota bacterium]